MSFGDALRRRMEQYQSAAENLPERLAECQENAAKEAIRVAAELTPPNENTPPRGAGTITGDTKSHWETDSQPVPQVNGSVYTSILANTKNHVSYLNDGFVMDKHFVPGLIVNPYSGLLEKVDPELGGIVVGTQTDYVPGLRMKEAAIKAYEETLDKQINEVIERLRSNG